MRMKDPIYCILRQLFGAIFEARVWPPYSIYRPTSHRSHTLRLLDLTRIHRQGDTVSRVQCIYKRVVARLISTLSSSGRISKDGMGHQRTLQLLRLQINVAYEVTGAVTSMQQKDLYSQLKNLDTLLEHRFVQSSTMTRKGFQSLKGLA